MAMFSRALWAGGSGVRRHALGEAGWAGMSAIQQWPWGPQTPPPFPAMGFPLPHCAPSEATFWPGLGTKDVPS